ncbi:hypothetical protein QP938_08505 [Porticoccaceae bacterium LTM1]|nr:hypothetical protein QP938_08505 [Porticoccaceae bacterium LTM1]
MGREQLDDDFEEVESEEVSDDDVVTNITAGMEIDARRRLEERLEQRRLQRELGDYDYDFDD